MNKLVILLLPIFLISLVSASWVTNEHRLYESFFDDFNRANSQDVGNGWVESENAWANTSIRENQLYIFDSTTQTSISRRIGQMSDLDLFNISFSTLRVCSVFPC